MNGNDELEREERGEDLEIKADMEHERLREIEDLDISIESIRAKEKLNKEDKNFIFEFQDSLDREEEKKLRDLSIETKVCAYCGGEVRTYPSGEDGWATNCIKCDSLFDED